MVLKGTLFIFCGKMASGKSTLAKKISQEQSCTLVSEDVLLAILYPGQIVDVNTYVHYSGRVKSAMSTMLVELLRNGTSVVLDFPANTVNQRKWMKDIVEQADAHSELHYLDSSDATCIDQLMKRANSEPDRHATDTIEMFNAMTRYFEPPSASEGFEIIHHDQN